MSGFSVICMLCIIGELMFVLQDDEKDPVFNGAYLSGIIGHNITNPLNKNKRCYYYEIPNEISKENNRTWMIHCYSNSPNPCDLPSDIKAFSLIANTSITRSHIKNLIELGDRNIDTENSYLINGMIIRCYNLACRFNTKFVGLIEFCTKDYLKHIIPHKYEPKLVVEIYNVYNLQDTNIVPIGRANNLVNMTRLKIKKDIYQQPTIYTYNGKTIINS